jgi:hypothetical protein
VGTGVAAGLQEVCVSVAVLPGTNSYLIIYVFPYLTLDGIGG